MDIRAFRRQNDFFIRCVQLSVTDIFLHAVIEQVDILLHDSDIPAYAFQRQAVNLLSVQEDFPAHYIVEMRNQVANGRFAAAAGSHQRKGFSFFNIQVHMTKDILVLIIGITDIPELDMTFKNACIGGIRAVCFRLFIHHLTKPLETGDSVFKLLHKVDQRHYRTDEHIDGNNECRVVPETDLAIIQEQAAGDQHYNIEHIGHKSISAVETAHGAVSCFAGNLEFPVSDFELFLLLICVGKSLGNPDTGYGAFHAGVDFRNGRTGIPESLPHFFAQAVGNNQQEGNTGKDDQGQPDIDCAQVHKSK